MEDLQVTSKASVFTALLLHSVLNMAILLLESHKYLLPTALKIS